MLREILTPQLVGFVVLIIAFVAFCLILLPLAFSYNPMRNTRESSSRARRREAVETFLVNKITETNERKDNEKLRSRIKVAGFGWSVVYFRLLQLGGASAIWLIVFILNSFKSFLNREAEFPVLFCMVVSLFLLFLPNIVLLLKGFSRREALALEIIQFSHRLVVCINENVSLYEAIRRAGRTAVLLRTHIDELLIGWLDDPKSAIQKFSDDIGIIEVLPITNTLLATWNVPKEKIVDLFQQQIRNIDTMRDFIVKKKIELSPLRQVFIVLFPFGIVVWLVIFPWYKELIALMKSTF